MLACVQPPIPLREKIGEGAPSSIIFWEEGAVFHLLLYRWLSILKDIYFLYRIKRL